MGPKAIILSAVAPDLFLGIPLAFSVPYMPYSPLELRQRLFSQVHLVQPIWDISTPANPRPLHSLPKLLTADLGCFLSCLWQPGRMGSLNILIGLGFCTLWTQAKHMTSCLNFPQLPRPSTQRLSSLDPPGSVLCPIDQHSLPFSKGELGPGPL